MKKLIRPQITLPTFLSKHLLSLFILLSMGGCLGCKLGGDSPKSYHANISLRLPSSINSQIRRIIDEGIVEALLLIKNESAFDTLHQETLEKITLEIKNQKNVHKVYYATEARNDFFDRRKLLATKYAEIKNDSLNLWELLKVFNLKALKGWQEKQFILLLTPEDITKPTSCTIELEGSQSGEKFVEISCEPLIDLSMKKESIKQANDDLLCVEMSIKNRNGLVLGKNFLQKCIFKIINPQNVDQIFYTRPQQPDGTYNISPISLNNPPSLWDITQFFSPSGILGDIRSKIEILVRPKNPTEKVSFRIEIWDSANNIISSENISS